MDVRGLNEGEEESVVQLLELVFSDWPRYDLTKSLTDFYRWKYLDSPTPSMILVIEDDAKLVSSYHTWRQKVWIRGEEYIHDQGMDFAVHPDYRGKGLSKIISQEARDVAQKEGIKVNNTVTEHPIVLHGHHTNKAVKPFPKKLVNMTRVKDIDKQLSVMPTENSLLIKFGYSALDIANDFLNIFRGKPLASGLIVREVDRFPDAVHFYWERIRDYYDYSLILSQEYLNWRYCDDRIGGFKVFTAEENGELVGFIVTRVNKLYPEYPIGYIVELSYLPDRKDIGYMLLEAALPGLSDVNVVNFLTVEGHPDIELLNLFRFHDSRIQLQAYYENYIPPDLLTQLHQSPSEKVHFSWGDYDVLPVKMPNV